MSKVISLIYKNIFNRVQIQVFNKLKQMGDLGDEAHAKHQLVKLKIVLNQAKNIPYYQKLINFDLNSLTYDNFITLPFLAKDDIRQNLDKLTNPKGNWNGQVFKNTSGGSTGTPVTFYQTRQQRQIALGSYYHALYLNGVNIYGRTLDLWGAERDMFKGNPQLDFKSRLNNRAFLNTFVLNEDIIRRYISFINDYKPEFIKAYVHSITDIARYINKNNIKITCKPVIHTTTGPLFEEMRTEISKAFNEAHVYSFYGSREVSAIATEVQGEKGMRIMYDNLIVEIINKEGLPAAFGEEGEIVVTTLNNHYMPLIRYKIGDRAINLDNKTEFGSLHISHVLGRTLGVIYKKDGSYIDGQFFVTLFFNEPGITQFQVVQETVDDVVVNVVKGEQFDEGRLIGVILRMATALQLPVAAIRVVYTSEIELTTTGKIMYVYSKVA